MSGERIDFASIDPSRDRARWNAMVASVAQQAWANRRKQLSVSYQLLRWGGPALAIAASMALVSWAGAWATGEGRTSASAKQDPEWTLSQWAGSDAIPAPTTVLQVLGGQNGTQ